MASISESRPSANLQYQAVIGVGGIGFGLLFCLEGNHDLRRNESRPARLVEARDYCKLHIILHYLAALLNGNSGGRSLRVVPVGKVGDDTEGQRLIREMAAVGIDTGYVEAVQGKPTLFSICYQYPDQSGGNITTSESAAASLTKPDVDRVIPLLEFCGRRTIVLAVPEVPLDVRHHLLKLATTSHALRVASFTSAEILEAQTRDIFGLVDLLAINEDEAGALIGVPFDRNRPQDFLEQCALTLTASQPDINIVVSAGKDGVFAFAGDHWSHAAALTVKAVSTMGAGDALLAGILAALILGTPLTNHPSLADENAQRTLGSAIEFGILLASFSLTSPHTIHPDANMENLLDFAGNMGVTFNQSLGQFLNSGDRTLPGAV